MAKLIVRRIPASTLLEVIIAMVIIMAVFTVAIGIYTKVTLSGLSVTKVSAQQHIKNIIHESVATKDWDESESIIDSIYYKKAVTPYAGYPDLVLVSVEASQNGTKLVSLSQIIKKQEHDN